MKGFFLLIRPINLLIIALTMYSVRLYLVVYEQVFDSHLTGLVLDRKSEQFQFFLLVLSTVMIAAAGNVINDYFDVRADRINKPKRVIIGKYINRRWAIIIHTLLNLSAFIIAIVLSVFNQSFWYVFIHLFTMNALWFYSLYLKKKPIVGNLLIAFLTALVPILCGVHFYVQGNTLTTNYQVHLSAFHYWFTALIEHGYFIWLLAFFAFANNFAREIIKDVEDIDGDKLLSAKTLPIQYGIKTAKIWIIALLTLPIVVFIGLFLYHQPKTDFSASEQLIIFIPVLSSLLLDCLAIFLTIRADSKTGFLKADQWVKFAMVCGVLTPLYWYLVWI